MKIEEYEKLSVISDIDKIHKKYITLFSDIEIHKTLVDPDFYIASREALTVQYHNELALAYENASVKTSEEFYLAKKRYEYMHAYSVRRWLKWQDSAVKELLDKRVKNELNGHLDELARGTDPINGELLDERTKRKKATQTVLYEVIICKLIELPGSRGLFGKRNIENTRTEILNLANEICDYFEAKYMQCMETIQASMHSGGSPILESNEKEKLNLFTPDHEPEDESGAEESDNPDEFFDEDLSRIEGELNALSEAEETYPEDATEEQPEAEQQKIELPDEEEPLEDSDDPNEPDDEGDKT